MDVGEDDDVDKSPNDTKTYRKICLKNGLTALLISDGLPGIDDDTSVSAAALCVEVGSFSEPDDVQGLAHFLEHMTFSGSQKFPEENGFDKFTRLHGGSTNAHTHMETTVYYFELQSNHFKDALDRFAQLFICPTLSQSWMEQERNLVHAEWAMQVHNDMPRFDQLLGSFAKEGHPMGKFTWGNYESLKTVPEQKGIDVHQALCNFQKQYYVANHMTLAVLSKESLDDLQCWVEELFSAIPFNSVPRPSFVHLGPPFDTPSFRRLYRIIPAKDMCQLKLTWALDSLLQHYRKKPLSYLGHLVGHEGPGSLHVLLWSRGWARRINSGNFDTSSEHNSTWAQYSVVVSLTEEGLKHFIDVITLIFQYLNLLRCEGVKPSIWQEIHDIDRNEFQWIEPQNPQEYVHQMSLDMHIYETRDYITGGKIIKEYDEQLIKACLDRLQPDKMNIAVSSKSFATENCADLRTEKWFQTKYAVQDILPEWIKMWSSCGRSSELCLPKPNIFIAKDFALKTPDLSYRNMDQPISSSDVSRLWYRSDNDYCVPKAFINFYIRSIEADKSSTNICLNDVFANLLRFLTSTVGYPAELAHLKYSIRAYTSGLSLTFLGFSDKLPLLVATIVDRIANFDVPEKLFTQTRNEMAVRCQNLSLHPETFHRLLRKSLLQSKHHSILKKMECIKTLTKDQVINYAKRFYDGAFVEGLVQGNLTAEEALQLETYVLSHLRIASTKDRKELCEIQVTKIPPGCSLFAISNRNSNDENSVILNYYQFGPSDIKEQMLNELVMMNMDEPCFNELRLQMQIGYEITVNHKSVLGVTGFWICVCTQASRFTAQFIDHVVEMFLQKYNNDSIQKMTQSSFDNFVSAAIKLKGNDDMNLSEEVNRHWMEIVQQTYAFKRHEEEIDALKKITLDEFKTWSKDLLTPSSTRRKLSVQVLGNIRPSAPGEKPKPPPKALNKRQLAKLKSINSPILEITDIDAFKAGCERYNFTR